MTVLCFNTSLNVAPLLRHHHFYHMSGEKYQVQIMNVEVVQIDSNTTLTLLQPALEQDVTRVQGERGPRDILPLLRRENKV